MSSFSICLMFTPDTSGTRARAAIARVLRTQLLEHLKHKQVYKNEIDMCHVSNILVTQEAKALLKTAKVLLRNSK